MPLARLHQYDRYRVRKFWRTNQDTAINQRPLVQLGQQVAQGQIIADGSATEDGELALGSNVLVAFMPWYGHNFEDAIVLSERLVKDDVYSSIHIQELELHVRDTKRGQEEITREIPNVSDEAVVDLDERGIVRIGAHVKPGDILVGKITPKGETELSPEEKLLTAIFGEKAKDVKDSSLKVPPGMAGVVIDVKIFSRVEDQVVEKDRGERIGEVRRVEADEKARIGTVMFEELKDLLDGQDVALMLRAGTVEEYLPAGTKLTAAQLAGIDLGDVDLKTLRVTNKAANERLRATIDAAARERAKVEEKSEDQIDKILQPDELPPGVIQLVKVYIAEKRKISVGDKMAGRHGNKGIVARIVPEEDMPFLPDGSPVDIVLNPLGVPSRMNVGQILETHLGWAASKLGYRAITPVFNGATETQIEEALAKAGCSGDGKSQLYDGRTGEPFTQRVTVGKLYMLKLHHLVDDKVHARATGPYSLITQQPLGGKARFGGQRFGEMEVWALEAYGAAHILQELLTVKSDDVDGRTKIYEAMVKNENILEPGTPVSFGVLCNEIKGLGLNIELHKRGSAEELLGA
jgi:DNA-directed RNA polymerase subunit beta